MNSHGPATTPATGAPMCPVCPRPLQPGQLMCPEHWRLVPGGIKWRLHRTFQELRAAERNTRPTTREQAEYQQAYSDAVDHVRIYHLPARQAAASTAAHPQETS